MKTIFRFTALFAVLYGASLLIPDGNSIVKMLCNTGLLSIFMLFILSNIRKEMRKRDKKTEK